MVYANDSEANLRRFSDQLERYHSAMEFVTSFKISKPSPSNRITVYVVSNTAKVRKLHGGDDKFVAGFYRPNAAGSIAIVPRVEAARGKLDFSMVTLLHEYAHHFGMSNTSFAMPRWLGEGFAEFFSSAKFYSDGAVGVGMVAQHRAGELFYAKDVTAFDLLDPEVYKSHRGKNYDAFYGRSWLLYHYLIFEPEVSGQLPKYISLLQQGMGQREAAEGAFGDLGDLEKRLDAYLNRSRMTAFKIPLANLKVGPVNVRKLSAGEAAIMPVRIQSKNGVNEESAKAVVEEARKVAAQFPNDPYVLSALAEAEFDSGSDDAAIKAADAALALDKTQVNAYVQKGYALFRQAQDGNNAADFVKARAPFVALNHLENDHPLPLIYYYRSFIEQGTKPSKLAIDGIEYALALAPYDQGLRMTVAMMELQQGRRDDARKTLKPIANNPHGGGLAEHARTILARMDAEPQWDGSGMYAPDDEGEEEGG